ncbi:MAG: YfhO family protein [Bacteroidota bacterium]|nr:YfhO family protein [Bacteroidota bacterium]
MAKGTKQSPQIQSSFPNIKDWHAIVVIVVSVVIFFRDILLQKAFMWEDFLYQYFPWRYFAATSLANGELPLWNPYTFNGMPFQADIPTATFYIPNLLLTLFVKSNKLHFYWVEFFIIIHFILAGVSMYYLLKSFKLEKAISLFGSIVFMLSGFMVTHTIHPQIIHHIAWLPLIFLLFKKNLDKKSLLNTILGGLTLGHSILAGFPQLSLYIFLLLFFYFLFEFVILSKVSGIKESVKIILPSAGVIFIAIAITAIQIIPTIELTPLSNRAEITYEKSQEGTFHPQQIITLLIPKFFGEQSAQVSNYWGQGQYWQYWETNFYIGIAGLLFAVFAFSIIHKNKLVLFFSIVFLFSILYALGDYFILHNFFFHNIPGFHLFRNPGRMSLLFTFSAAILSGFGLNEIIKSSNLPDNQAGKKLLTKISLITIVVGGAVWGVVQLGLFQEHPNAQYLQEIRNIAHTQSNIMLAFAAVIAIVIFIFSRFKISTFIFIALILLIQFIDMYNFGFNFNNGKVSPTEYYKRTERLTSFLKTEGEKEYFRINSRQGGNMLLDRNQGMVDKLFLMEGYTPLGLQRAFTIGSSWEKICDLHNVKYRIQIDEERQSMGLTQSTTYLPRAWFVYNYKVISEDEKIKEFMSRPDFDPSQVVVLEEEIKLPPAQNRSWDSWKAKIISYKLNSISLDVSTPDDGVLVLSEIFYPGWKAYVDGVEQNILRANWNLRAIKVKKGQYKIEIRFEPNPLYNGAIISFATIGLCAIGIVYSLRKKNNKI